jgi:hypothetical protein
MTFLKKNEDYNIFFIDFRILKFYEIFRTSSFFLKKAIMNRFIMALKAIIDRQSILEQNNVLAISKISNFPKNSK